MRSLSILETFAVSGADLHLGGNSWAHIPSTGIPSAQFNIIEAGYQKYVYGVWNDAQLDSYLISNNVYQYDFIYLSNMENGFTYVK